MRKIIRILVLLAIFAIPVLLALMWLDHFRETKLPQPTGPFAVGRVMYARKDATHTDPMATEPGTTRELVAWIWYPAAPTQPSQVTSEYLPPSWRTAVEHQRGGLLTQFLTRNLSGVRTHSTRDAEVSAQQPSYPVVVMRAGLSGLMTGYTSL